MSVGDVTKVPAGGIQIAPKVARVNGNTTTLYVGDEEGSIKTLTTSGTLADLTTKVKLNGCIVALVYTGISVVYGGVTATTALMAILADGRVYAVQPDGSKVILVRSLNMGVADAYYYSNYLYVLLSGVQQELSSFCKIQLA